MTKDHHSEGRTMSEETRITANPLPKDTRTTADVPSGADTHICLTPPKPKHQFWKWLPWVSFILGLAAVSVNVATVQQRARYRQSLIEIQRRQAEIENTRKEIDKTQKEIDKTQAEIDRQIREAQRGK
jgi:hypothetical protein